MCALAYAFGAQLFVADQCCIELQKNGRKNLPALHPLTQRARKVNA